jgi:hypothetical protein
MRVGRSGYRAGHAPTYVGTLICWRVPGGRDAAVAKVAGHAVPDGGLRVSSTLISTMLGQSPSSVAGPRPGPAGGMDRMG